VTLRPLVRSSANILSREPEAPRDLSSAGGALPRAWAFRGHGLAMTQDLEATITTTVEGPRSRQRLYIGIATVRGFSVSRLPARRFDTIGW